MQSQVLMKLKRSGIAIVLDSANLDVLISRHLPSSPPTHELQASSSSDSHLSTSLESCSDTRNSFYLHRALGSLVLDFGEVHHLVIVVAVIDSSVIGTLLGRCKSFDRSSLKLGASSCECLRRSSGSRGTGCLVALLDCKFTHQPLYTLAEMEDHVSLSRWCRLINSPDSFSREPFLAHFGLKLLAGLLIQLRSSVVQHVEKSYKGLSLQFSSPLWPHLDI